MDVEERILDVLRENREGVMIIDLASYIHVHRHTAKKYIYKLVEEGKVKLKKIGIAKLCYLNEESEVEQQKHFLPTLRKNILSRITAKVMILFFILLVIGQGIILAQSAGIFNITSNDSITEPTINETFNETITTTTTTTTTVTTSIITIIVPTTTTITATTTSLTTTTALSNQTTTTIVPTADLSVEITSFNKTTRGSEEKLIATVTNYGPAEAKNVLISWELPEGFEITSGFLNENCGNLLEGNFCSSSIIIQSSLATSPGINEIKVRVNYG